MSMSDPIADYLTRIRNGLHAKKKHVDIPSSNIKRKMSRILLEQGFVKKYIILDDGKQGLIRVWLKYDELNNPVIHNIKRISKPGKRLYVSVDQLPRVKNNLGVSIMTTPKGIITAREAKRHNVGGEVLCQIW
jgi:small subunit ribosomal protein S8